MRDTLMAAMISEGIIDEDMAWRVSRPDRVMIAFDIGAHCGGVSASFTFADVRKDFYSLLREINEKNGTKV